MRNSKKALLKGILIILEDTLNVISKFSHNNLTIYHIIRYNHLLSIYIYIYIYRLTINFICISILLCIFSKGYRHALNYKSVYRFEERDNYEIVIHSDPMMFKNIFLNEI